MLYFLLILYLLDEADFRDWSKAKDLKDENQELKDKLRKYEKEY